MMKQALLAAAVALTASSAFAADKGGSVAHPMIAEARPISWTGCHLSAGVSRETSVQNAAIDGSSVDLGSSGTLAALGVGCDYQMDRLVFGGIARYALGYDSGSADGLRWKSDRQWMVAARAGHLITDNLLAYVLAGIHGVHQSVALDGLSASASPTGFIGGLGMEARLTSHISVRLEGDWSTARSSMDDVVGLRLKPETQTIRGEVVYHFVGMR